MSSGSSAGTRRRTPDPRLPVRAGRLLRVRALWLAPLVVGSVVLAATGQRQEARAALNEAVGWYEGLNARWDVRRADGRLRAFGVRRRVRGPAGQRAVSGWSALTPTEVKIAALVARGDSTTDIARGMFLSRRTVQTYISHILTKLGAKGRVEIVREALRHGVSP